MIPPRSHVEHLDAIAIMYDDGLFPTLMCPLGLFLNIIHINLLRFERAQLPESTQELCQRANELVEQIENFQTADWVASVPSGGQGLLLVAEMYQSAVMIYCISSLQSVFATYNAVFLRDTKVRHFKRLMALLREGLKSPQLRDSLTKCTLWLLIVAGTELRAGGLEDRAFVEDQLGGMCREIGSSLPILAIGVLTQFWQSSNSAWDDCFTRPYAFVT